MPAKYQGALVGIGAEPRVGLCSQGRIKNDRIAMITAINTTATTSSRKIKFGMVGTFTRGVRVFIGLRGTTRPPDLRTRQK